MRWQWELGEKNTWDDMGIGDTRKEARGGSAEGAGGVAAPTTAMKLQWSKRWMDGGGKRRAGRRRPGGLCLVPAWWKTAGTVTGGTGTLGLTGLVGVVRPRGRGKKEERKKKKDKKWFSIWKFSENILGYEEVNKIGVFRIRQRNLDASENWISSRRIEVKASK